MPRFIVERNNLSAAAAVRHQGGGVRLVRTFLMGGKIFDVYIADDRDAFDRHMRRPDFLSVCTND